MSNTPPSVAAIIPTMDRPDRVERAVRSVIDQTYDQIEIVVVDGGSDDRTPEVIDRLRTETDHPIQLLRNDEPQGLPAARNQGVAATDTDLVAFLDDDDTWHPDKTARQVQTLEETNADVVYAGFVSKDASGSHVHTRTPELRGDIYDELLVENVVGPPSTVMVSRAAFDQVGGFDEDLYHQEDWDFYLTLAREFEYACVSAPLVTRAVHDGMMSQSVAKQKRHREAILTRNESQLKQRGLFARAWASHHRGAARTHFANGEMTAGRRELREALGYRSDPYTLFLYAVSLTGPEGFSLATRIKRALARHVG